MGIFDALFGKGKIGGEIAYYNLEDWWIGDFTDAERKYILKQYQPMGLSDNDIISGQILESSASVVQFLSGLASWFNKDEDRYLAKLICQKAESLLYDDTKVLDIHFLYQTKIMVYYRDRDKSDCLDIAITACQQQINVAKQAIKAFKKKFEDGLPGHKGFEQLAIILEKKKNFVEAIALCKKALEQGWAGDWDKRIQRCHRKIGNF
ncbi:MAG: hypothetical protein DRP35_11520 [Candidatus Zixiibacteriota bacterium]|nr:MAG: hypothetical protein DRP35_11520 [candidate division Zixibacteria bacterium]